jgi:hypothetical protein
MLKGGNVSPQKEWFVQGKPNIYWKAALLSSISISIYKYTVQDTQYVVDKPLIIYVIL